MANAALDEPAIKQALKEVLVETLQENRDFLHEVFAEVLEEFALGEAIREGRKTKLVPREDVSTRGNSMKPITTCLAVIALFVCTERCQTQESNPASKKRIETLETEREKLSRRLAEIDADLLRLKGGKSKARLDFPRIEAFLGISSDLKTCAVSVTENVNKSVAGGLKLVDLEPGRQSVSPKWDRDWGTPRTVLFGQEIVVVVAGRDGSNSIRIFSRKTGELEQNIRGQMDSATLTTDGRFIAVTEFRSGKGYHLVLRDIQEKKVVAEIKLGSNGFCSLCGSGSLVAACETHDAQITVAEGDTGRVITTLKTDRFRKKKNSEFGIGSASGRIPIAIAPTGNLIACEADDAVILYDVKNDKVVQKLEGHLDVVQAVAFSPSGEIVASSAKDKTIRFWNVKDGKELGVIKNLPSGASELLFSSDGKRLLIVYRDDRFGGSRRASAEIRTVELK